MTSANQTPGEYEFAPFVASQQGRTNQHEPVCFGLFSHWSFSSRSGIPLYAVVRPWLSLQRTAHSAIQCSAPCSAVLRHSPSSGAAVVHWSALMPKALRSSRKQSHPLFFLVPHATRHPQHFSEYHALRQSRILHARHKFRKQDPRPALISRLDKRVQIENRVAGAIVFSPTEAANQGPAVGSAQRVVVARAQAPRHAAVQFCPSASALSIRILSSRAARGRSYSSRVYFRKLYHAFRMRRSTSMDRSALWLTFTPRYTNSFVWLYTWPADSTLNVAVVSGIPFARKHMISALASDTVRPNAAYTTTINPSSSSAARVIARRARHRHRKACLKAASRGQSLRQLLPPAPSPPFSSSGVPKRP